MEDFVPYELAVKLNEVGFNYDTKEVYEINVSLERYFEIPKPTISQVLKWLRENSKLHISTKPSPCEDRVMWEYEVRSFSPVLVCVIVNKTGFQKPELAAIAGIEYVIDNFI